MSATNERILISPLDLKRSRKDSSRQHRPIFLVFGLFRMTGDNVIMLDRVQELFRASGRQRENRG